MTRAVLLAALIALAPHQLTAQGVGSGSGARATDPRTIVVLSRADSLLAVGRLAAAENVLYAEVAARPRAPEPRGALAAYLASRARFRIAEVLFEEAQRFGADRRAVQRAIAEMAPYRVSVPAGPVTAVPFTPVADPTALGGFTVRARRGGDEFTAVLDLRVRGVVIGRAAADAFSVRGRRGAENVAELWIGERQLEGVEVSVDAQLSPRELRMGLDVLWGLHPQIDARAGMLTLGREPDVGAITGPVQQIPFVLTFPGLSLIPRVGSAPIPLESRAGRALLSGSRWQIDARTATLVVER
jgi:hypothetical protein